MATFDQPSDLIHRIAYPTIRRPELRIDSRARTVPREEEEQLPVPSSQQGIEDSLFREVEPGARRNPWASAGSVAFLSLVLLALIVAPLYRIETLPKAEVLTRLYLQPPAAAGSTATRIQAPTSRFIPTNISIPRVPETQETTPPPPPTPMAATGGVVGGVSGGVVGGVPIGVPSEVMGTTGSGPVPAKAPDPTPIKRIRVPSRIAEANLVYDVAPTYPPEAGRARIEGTVVLLAVIGKDGSVQDVQVESGLSLLAQAAVNAVKQWRYKPYLLDGEQVEVASRITINFTLS